MYRKECNIAGKKKERKGGPVVRKGQDGRSKKGSSKDK
jgi:hypothetical protein